MKKCLNDGKFIVVAWNYVDRLNGIPHSTLYVNGLFTALKCQGQGYFRRKFEEI